MERMGFEIIAFKILDYLNEHPNAQDSTEGIINWWLLQMDINYQSSQVGEVLRVLSAKDVLLEQNQMGALTYKINPNRRDEISSLIKLLKRDFT